MCPILGDLPDVIMRLQLLVFELLWWLEELEQNQCHSWGHLGQGGPREQQAGEHHLSPWESDGIIPPEIIHRHRQDRKVMNAQYEFTTGMSCLTNLIIFHDAMPGLLFSPPFYPLLPFPSMHRYFSWSLYPLNHFFSYPVSQLAPFFQSQVITLYHILHFSPQHWNMQSKLFLGSCLTNGEFLFIPICSY